jgi:iron-sulfur cluster repair protein YtfE (RIC family)
LKKEYLRRLGLVLETELNAKNKIQATGALEVPVLLYSFGIINWHREELRKLDRKTRKLLTIHGQHHPKADVDRLYVSRKYGGRGLMQLEEAYVIEITKLMEYVDSTEDPLIQTARTHQNNTKSATVQTARSLGTELQRGTRQIKDSIAEKTQEKWQGKRCINNFHVA